MTERGVRRFSWNRRKIAVLLVVLAVALAAVWLLLLRPWLLTEQRPTLQRRLDSNVAQIANYRDRVEATMRLQLLQAAVADGRRSPALRPEYRLLEDVVEAVIAREESDARAGLQAELTELLPDLSRDRPSAFARIERLIDLTRTTAGPGRQGEK